MRLAIPLMLFAAGCGRLGFDAMPRDGSLGDGSVSDGVGDQGDASDAATDAMPLACADVFLGSAVGSVHTASTASTGNDYTICSGGNASDTSLHWIAPATASFRIDLCSSTNITWDSTLLVLGDSCTGPQLACDDDTCLTSLHARVTIAATQGRSYVIVVDGSAGDTGTYTLSIAQQ